MTACRYCPNESALAAYWDDTLTLCPTCARDLADRLDAEDIWPPVEFGPLTVVIPETTLRYDGRELIRLYELLHLYGSRIHVTFDRGRPALSFTEPMPLEAAEIASHHGGLLVSAWLARERFIMACDDCLSPFLLARQSRPTRCPVCGQGKRGTHILLPFTDSPARRKRPA
jgi:hypothetical protein